MLTFQAIRDVERAERDSRRLQRLPEAWHSDLADYLREKEGQTDKRPEDLLEIQNVKGITQRLLDLREKKILDQALVTVRTGAPPENLLKQEEDVFWTVVESLKRFRADFLEPSTQPLEKVGSKDGKVAQNQPLETSFSKKLDQKEKVAQKPELEQKEKRYRIKKSMGPFVGPDMRTYSLKEGEVVALPQALVEILAGKGAIEEVA